MVDDLDGTDADETVEFALDQQGYTIDLSEKNATELRELLAPYVAAGVPTASARVSNSAPRRSRRSAAKPASNGSGPDPKAVRQWANENGYELFGRGRIPARVVAAYEAAV